MHKNGGMIFHDVVSNASAISEGDNFYSLSIQNWESSDFFDIINGRARTFLPLAVEGLF